MQLESFAVVIAARRAQDEISDTLESLLPAPSGLAVHVILITNGPPDRTAEIAEEFRERFEATGGSLVSEHLDVQGKAPALRHGVAVAPRGPVLLLDTRVELVAKSIDRMLEMIDRGDHDVVSAAQLYQDSPSRLVSAFARGYAKAPYGRSSDLKGTCLLLSHDHRGSLAELPDTGADDRYMVASTTRDRRQVVDGAFVKYFFPDTFRGLLAQQTRWVRGNRGFDTTVVDYDRGAHELDRRPYFGEQRPDIFAVAVYGFVMVWAHIGARLGPPDTPSW